MQRYQRPQQYPYRPPHVMPVPFQPRGGGGQAPNQQRYAPPQYGYQGQHYDNFRGRAPRPQAARPFLQQHRQSHYQTRGPFVQAPGVFDLTSKVVIPPPKEAHVIPDCICERKVEYVLCNSCAFLEESGKVRVRQLCPIHPKRISYTDMVNCPTCKSELTEYLPKGEEMDAE